MLYCRVCKPMIATTGDATGDNTGVTLLNQFAHLTSTRRRNSVRTSEFTAAVGAFSANS